MIFCKIARILGIAGAVFGLMGVVLGLTVALSDTPAADTARYLGSKSSGEAIDQGILRFVAAVVIGAVGEIGMLLARQRA